MLAASSVDLLLGFLDIDKISWHSHDLAELRVNALSIPQLPLLVCCTPRHCQARKSVGHGAKPLHVEVSLLIACVSLILVGELVIVP